MATRNIPCGNTVQWTATFFDMNGAPTNPTSALIRITYSTALSTAQTDVSSMVQSSNTWTGTWYSSLAIAGNADWHLQATGTSINSAYDGNFTLTANTANNQ